MDYEDNYYDEDEDYIYTPTPEELRYEAVERAKRLFPRNCEYTGLTAVNVEDWELEDLLLQGEEYANYFRAEAEDRYGLSVRDMQSARIESMDKDIAEVIRSWRVWQRFVISLKQHI